MSNLQEKSLAPLVNLGDAEIETSSLKLTVLVKLLMAVLGDDPRGIKSASGLTEVLLPSLSLSSLTLTSLLNLTSPVNVTSVTADGQVDKPLLKPFP